MVVGGAHLPIAVFIPMRFALARVTDPASLGVISVLELKLKPLRMILRQARARNVAVVIVVVLAFALLTSTS